MTEPLPLDLGEPTKTAVISKCGKYRYELTRRWSHGPLLEWLMLNPSVADANTDDPTIRRCIGFAKDWGFNGIRVTNLFAYRATDPDELLTADKPLGPLNFSYLAKEYGPITVCAWGSHKARAARSFGEHFHIRARSSLMCLGYNADGSPKHPLYVPKNAGLRPWPKPKEVHY